MPRSFKRISKKRGLPPGSLVHIGEQTLEMTKVWSISYDGDSIEQQDHSTEEELFHLVGKRKNLWINVIGLSDTAAMAHIGEQFKIPPLFLEDILNTDHRSKIEVIGDHTLVLLKAFEFGARFGGLKSEQIALLIGPDCVITFREGDGDIFHSVIDRLHAGKCLLRSGDAEFLCYSIVDAIVDSYFEIIEEMGDVMERIEEEIISSPKSSCISKIHHLKRDMILLRKAIWPVREVISTLRDRDVKMDSELRSAHYRDIYEHTIHVMDTLESFRDILSGMLETYMSIINNRMNEVMKVLTIVGTIFIPLTFLAGVYGMNFDSMPELSWRWFYPAGFWILSLSVASGMLLAFKAKRWL